MKLKLIATIALTSLGALSILTLQDSVAAPKEKGEKAVGEKAAPRAIPMPVFPGLKFGMSLEQIAKLNDKDLDGEFKKRFLAASPSKSNRRGSCCFTIRAMQSCSATLHGPLASAFTSSNVPIVRSRRIRRAPSTSASQMPCRPARPRCGW